jgi:adenylate cyclase
VAEVSRLDPEKIAPLTGSIFRELNEQARAFNAMLRGLRRLEIHVPRRLLERLMTAGVESEMATEARIVTVMFTDIVAFTRYSGDRSAAQVAAFLNRHFAMVAEAVEAEGGTVDKFIGDSVMAFWGAPEAQPDHAERAVRATRAIAVALATLNARRQEESKPPIRMRIGLHGGPVAVGNIGAPGRMNYTIVGDAVNTANRVEQIAKTIMVPEENICGLASDAVIHALDEDSVAEPVGEFHVPGRFEPARIYRLA